jgi:hypothetical protein
MTQKHPQQERPYKRQETLREGLTDAQMEVLTDGLCLLHRICNGPDSNPLPRNYARIYADQAIDLLDKYAAADRDNI